MLVEGMSVGEGGRRGGARTIPPGYLKRIIHLQTVRQNWQVKSGGWFIQN